jgi:hypothetical protein
LTVKHALGVVVHAKITEQLAESYYGTAVANSWSVVPLAQGVLINPGETGRSLLNLKPDDFVVCSFGMLGYNK